MFFLLLQMYLLLFITHKKHPAVSAECLLPVRFIIIPHYDYFKIYPSSVYSGYIPKIQYYAYNMSLLFQLSYALFIKY